MRYILAVLFVLTLVPQKAFALAVETFFTDTGGKRHFAEDVTKYSGKISGCGYIFASSFSPDVVIKGSAMQQRKQDLTEEQIKSNSPHNFISHVEVTAGKIGDDKSFNKYLIDKATMTSPWLSREVNLTEFPSDNLQLGGHFVQKMLFTGFTFNIFVPSLGGESGHTIPISARAVPGKAKDEYLNCISVITK